MHETVRRGILWWLLVEQWQHYRLCRYRLTSVIDLGAGGGMPALPPRNHGIQESISPL